MENEIFNLSIELAQKLETQIQNIGVIHWIRSGGS